MRTDSFILIVVTLVLLLLSSLSLNSYIPKTYSWIAIIAIDIYLVLVLTIAAIKSDKKILLKGWRDFLLPTRSTGLLLFGFLLITVILSYAGVYMQHRDQIEPVITNSFDAFYFSFMTVTTLGYGKFVPDTTCTKWIVMWEFGSGVLLFTGGLALLISRLSNFEKD